MPSYYTILYFYSSPYAEAEVAVCLIYYLWELAGNVLYIYTTHTQISMHSHVYIINTNSKKLQRVFAGSLVRWNFEMLCNCLFHSVKYIQIHMFICMIFISTIHISLCWFFFILFIVALAFFVLAYKYTFVHTHTQTYSVSARLFVVVVFYFILFIRLFVFLLSSSPWSRLPPPPLLLL